MESAIWHDNWPLARQRFVDWWEGRGCGLCVAAFRDEPWAAVTDPGEPKDLLSRWTDPGWRMQQDLFWNSRTYFGGIAFPSFGTQIGAGSLGVMLGSEPVYAEDTVWFETCLPELDGPEPLAIQWDFKPTRDHFALIDESIRVASGRGFATIPDLIENLDTLCQLHGPQETMIALLDQPAAVERRLREITDRFLEVYDLIYEKVKAPDGSSAFSVFALWGPGKTAKVQCDAAAMLSPELFRRFVQPELRRQCDALDHAMYHLDGTQAIPCLDAVLEIDSIQAIEWTPQAGIEEGGHPRWYDLYRRIRAAGRSVQAIGVKPEEVLPLLDACGPEGMFVMTSVNTESEARALEKAVYG